MTTESVVKQEAAKPTTAIAKKGQPTIQQFLESRKDLIAQVAPKHLTPDRLIKVALMARARNKALLLCSPESLLQAVINAAELGLEPSGLLGQAYLVPYGKDVQLIPGYRGLIDLARRSGQISRIEAHVVHENDTFDISYGIEPKLEHKPTLSANPGKPVAVYAIAKLKDGTTQVEVMTISQVEAIRSRSKAAKSGPWVTDFEEMARKTVVRRLCKYLPLSPELQKALEFEESIESGREAMVEVVVPPSEDEAKGGAAEAKARIRKAQQAKHVEAQVVEIHEAGEPTIDAEPPPMSDEEIAAIKAS